MELWPDLCSTRDPGLCSSVLHQPVCEWYWFPQWLWWPDTQFGKHVSLMFPLDNRSWFWKKLLFSFLPQRVCSLEGQFLSPANAFLSSTVWAVYPNPVDPVCLVATVGVWGSFYSFEKLSFFICNVAYSQGSGLSCRENNSDRFWGYVPHPLQS